MLREIDWNVSKGLLTQCYRNLNQKGVMSIRQQVNKSWLVVGHSQDLVMRNVNFQVSLASRDRVIRYTLDIVLQAICRPDIQMPLNWTPIPSIESAVDTFVGYLLIDTWIGNGDRHHENWGFVNTNQRSIHLAPTYDHASSLGRELTDEKRRKLLGNRAIGGYLKKNYSAFYAQSNDLKSLTTIAVFQAAAQSHPQAARAWLSQLSGISSDWLANLLARVPEDRMSPVAKELALEILLFNQDRLLTLSVEKS